MIMKSPTFIDNLLLIFPNKNAHANFKGLDANCQIRAQNFESLFIKESPTINGL